MKQVSAGLFRVLVSMVSASFTPGAAQTVDKPVRKLELLAGQGIVLDFESDVTRVYSSNPEIADPAVSTAREVLLNAKAPGIATLVVWLQSGVRETFAARISSDFETARILLRDTFPAEDITLHGSKDGLSLVGRVSTQEISDRAVALLKPIAQSVVSNLQIATPRGLRQIGLKVIFAEVNRKATEQLGVNLLSTGGKMPGAITTGQFPGLSPTPSGTTLNLSDALNVFAFRPDLNLAITIKALAQQGLLEILAEPNLVTSEGKEARFMVGGEFPVPVPQAGSATGAITIQFREFGIRLTFLPTMTPNGTIRLHVQPEVSTIDLANGVVLNGFSIPALTTRKIETDIELREGQSFAIAGLLDDRVTESLSRVPGLASIPFFGALFRSRDLVKTKTELVVLVTPSVRYPLPDRDELPLPVMPSPFLPAFPKRMPAPGASLESRETGLQTERQAIYREERQSTLIRSMIGMFEETTSSNATAAAGPHPRKPSDVLRRQLEELSARYGNQHPDVIDAADVVALALALEEEAEKAAAGKEKVR